MLLKFSINRSILPTIFIVHRFNNPYFEMPPSSIKRFTYGVTLTHSSCIEIRGAHGWRIEGNLCPPVVYRFRRIAKWQIDNILIVIIIIASYRYILQTNPHRKPTSLLFSLDVMCLSHCSSYVQQCWKYIGFLGIAHETNFGNEMDDVEEICNGSKRIENKHGGGHLRTDIYLYCSIYEDILVINFIIKLYLQIFLRAFILHLLFVLPRLLYLCQKHYYQIISAFNVDLKIYGLMQDVHYALQVLKMSTILFISSFSIYEMDGHFKHRKALEL